ncbi:MAG: hypothetical protein ACREA7_09735 [Nitrosotalea sp.]
MFPKDLSDFYQLSVHLIYAVIIAQTYVIVTDIFLPIDKLDTYDGVVSAFALGLAYFVIISGWIGYFKSIKRDPHKGRAGNARFAVDLIILFLFYYLLTLADPTNKADYWYTFVWVFPVIFAAYLAWDCLKYHEYIHEHASEKNYRKGRLKITIVFFAIFLVQAFAYYFATNYHPDLIWQGHVAWNLIFIPSSILFTYLYRRRKWKTGNKRKSLTKTKKPNNSASTI